MNLYLKNLSAVNPCISVEKLEDYISNQLDDTEEYEIEHHLSACSACADVVETLRTSDSKGIEERLKQMQAAFDSESGSATSTQTGSGNQRDVLQLTKRPKVFKGLNLLIAACVLSGIMMIGYYFYRQNNREKDQIAQSTLHEDSLNTIDHNPIQNVMTNGADSSQALQYAIHLFRNKKYQPCIDLIVSELHNAQVNRRKELLILLFKAYWLNEDPVKADSILNQNKDVVTFYKDEIERFKQKNRLKNN